MCGRYQFTPEDDREINSIFDQLNKKYNSENYNTGEIYPTNYAPVLVGRDNHVTAEVFKWGYPNFNNKGVLINARAEILAEKKMFKSSLETKRCVIPSIGFFEWSHDAQKRKYQFNVPESKTLYMAGLYNIFNGEVRFVIITTEANDSMKDIHRRMPVILKKAWLGNGFLMIQL